MKFTITGYNGKPSTGRGRLIAREPNGTALVELLTNDLGGFGTYHRGMLLRIYQDEIHAHPQSP